MACPHADIRFCPLYHASHMDNVSGCDDGRLQEGCCAVARGMDYHVAVAAMEAVEPRLVAQLRFDEDAAARVAQQRRNMRLLRLH